MYRSLVCMHCGTAVALETRTDPIGGRLAAHLLGLHGDRVAFAGRPRWADLFEHFRVIPRLSS